MYECENVTAYVYNRLIKFKLKKISISLEIAVIEKDPILVRKMLHQKYDKTINPIITYKKIK